MGKLLGTLVVVIDRAKNLVNKQRIGKQDPYCVVNYASQKKRTKTIKKGGQTPTWDEELRFEIWENAQDEVSSEVDATGGVRPVQETAPKKTPFSSQKKEIKVAVYADDLKDPDLVGENTVDISDVIKKGEWDEWVPLMNRGRYSGEIKLELTFYGAGPAPAKKPRPVSANYSGPGTFEPITSTSKPTTPVRNQAPSPALSSANTPSGRPLSRPDINSIPLHLRPGSPPKSPNTNSNRLSVNGNAGLRASASYNNLSDAVMQTAPDKFGSLNSRRSSFGLHSSQSHVMADPMRSDSYPPPLNNLQQVSNSHLGAPLPPPRRTTSMHDNMLSYQEAQDFRTNHLRRSPSNVSVNKPLPVPQAVSHQQYETIPPQVASFQLPTSHVQSMQVGQQPMRQSVSAYDLHQMVASLPSADSQQPQDSYPAAQPVYQPQTTQFIDHRQASPLYHQSPSPLHNERLPNPSHSPHPSISSISRPPSSSTQYHVPFPSQSPLQHPIQSHYASDQNSNQSPAVPPRSQSMSFSVGQIVPQSIQQPYYQLVSTSQQQQQYQQNPTNYAQANEYHPPLETRHASFGHEPVNYAPVQQQAYVPSPNIMSTPLQPFQPQQNMNVFSPPLQEAVHFAPTHVGQIPPRIPPRPYATTPDPNYNYQQVQATSNNQQGFYGYHQPNYAPQSDGVQQQGSYMTNQHRHSNPLPMPPSQFNQTRPLPPISQQGHFEPAPEGYSQQQWTQQRYRA